MASTVVAPREDRVITVKGDLCTVQRTIVEREVKTSDLIDELCKGRLLSTDVLPHNCVMYTRFNDPHSNALVSIYVVELPPHVRKAVYKRNPINADEERHPERCIKELALSWPFTQWFVRFKNSGLMDVYLACAKQPLCKDAFATPIYYLPMPNQYEYGTKGFCTGNITVDMGLSFANKVDAVMEQLLTSMWNEDLPVDFRDSGVVNLPDWHEKTAADPDFWKKIRFKAIKWRDYQSLMNWLGFPQ
jgi:hypothetical protein